MIDPANRFRLTDSECDIAKQALKALPYDEWGQEDYVARVRALADQALPDRVVHALHRQRAALNPRPYLIIDNLPTDDEVFSSPAPGELGGACKTGAISENLAVGVAALIGEPYSIDFEGSHIVNNLTPEKSQALGYTGLGSAVELDFHIENAALKFHSDLNLTPTGLLLTGVRQDPGMPKTRLADGRRAFKLLEPQDRATLRGKNYSILVPYRWRDAFSSNGSIQTAPAPLVSGDARLPEIHAVFYPDMVEPLSGEAKLAFDRFYDAVRKVSFDVDIMPGRLVYVDNRFTLHSRDKFDARYDDNGRPMRWLQRVFVASSLWPHRMLRSVRGRVFQPVGRDG